MADLYDLLAATQGGEESYLKQSPLYGTGIGIANMPLPKAKTSAQAIIGPLLQGLLAGSLVNAGRNSAYDAAYEDAQANPLLSTLSSYKAETRPEGWEPDRAKNDLLLALIGKQQQDERAAESIKQAGELQKALATQGVVLQPDGSAAPLSGYAAAKAGIEQATKEAALRAEMGGMGGIPGVPANKQAQAIEEVGVLQQLVKSQNAVERIYSDVKNAKEAIPFGALGRTAEHLSPAQTDHERKLAAVHTTLVAMAQGILGAEPNARMQERIAELTPSRLDSPAAVEEKAKLAKAFLADLAKPTPTLSTYGAQMQQQQQRQETVRAPDGNEYVFID